MCAVKEGMYEKLALQRPIWNGRVLVLAGRLYASLTTLCRLYLRGIEHRSARSEFLEAFLKLQVVDSLNPGTLCMTAALLTQACLLEWALYTMNSCHVIRAVNVYTYTYAITALMQSPEDSQIHVKPIRRPNT